MTPLGIVAIVAGLLAVFALGILTERRRRLRAWRATARGGVVTDWPVRTTRTRHHLFARGGRRDLPILLFVPGGPGESLVPRWAEFTAALAERFVVILIETGVGRAAPFADPPTMADLVADYAEVIDAVRARFEGAPVLLAGHALGAAIALRLARDRPDLVDGLVAIAPLIHWQRGNDASTAHLRGLARDAGDTAASAVLAALPAGLATPDGTAMDLSAVAAQRAVLRVYGLDSVTGRHTAEANAAAYLLSPLHGVRTACAMLEGRRLCRWIGGPVRRGQWRRVLADVATFDAWTAIPALAVPVLVVVGEVDWITPTSLATGYLDALSAPAKRLVVLCGAGHYPQLDDPTGFQRAVIAFLDDQPT